jgi:uncharacterized membrane protein HdeD (DUF308 family)
MIMSENSEPKKAETIGADMTKRVKNVKLEVILLNVAVLLIGIIMVVYPGASANIICSVIGILLCAAGVYLIVSYFVRSKLVVLGSFSLVQGVVLAGLGAYILIKPEFLAAIITVILAIILIAGGAMKLQYGMDFMRLKLSGWWFELIGAALMIVLGVVAIANPFAAASALMIYLGVCLIVDAVWDLASITVLSSQLKNLRKNASAVLNEVSADDPIVG